MCVNVNGVCVCAHVHGICVCVCMFVSVYGVYAQYGCVYGVCVCMGACMVCVCMCVCTCAWEERRLDTFPSRTEFQ